ncbi:MAG: signal peptidase II [Planctomycetes bacterium]|nr:signal peptidase II [Planctomycetota bacterium]
MARGNRSMRAAVFLVIAVAGCSIDLLTKHWVFAWRGMPEANPEWWIVEGFFGIETALNPGALFGMGAGGSPFFAALSIIAGLAVLYLVLIRDWARDWLLTIALACVLGGILGNLYDRLGLWSPPGSPDRFHTEVRDWILFRFRGYTWPNFNIADSLLVVGAALIMVHARLEPRSPDPRSPDPRSPDPRSPASVEGVRAAQAAAAPRPEPETSNGARGGRRGGAGSARSIGTDEVRR